MRNEIGRPMTLGRRLAVVFTIAAVVGGPIAGGALAVQSQVVVPPSTLAFETASISRSNLFRGQPVPTGDLEAAAVKAAISRMQEGRFRTLGSTLHLLIQAAYNLRDSQVEGGPSWVRSDRYAIDAQTDANITPDQTRGMIQSLLADRFKLALRRDTRTMPVYELAVADGGLRITAMKPGECTPGKEIRWDVIDLEAPLYVCDGGGRKRILSQLPETRPLPRWPRVTRLEFGDVSISALIDFISRDVDRLVVDKTGFTQRFNLLLDFASARDAASSGPTIFEALREQLGLELQPTSALVDVFVIDSVERPAIN